MLIEQHNFDDEPLPSVIPYTKAAIIADLRADLKSKQFQLKQLEIEIETIAKTLSEIL